MLRAAAVLAGTAVGADHPVGGNDDRDRSARAGTADGAVGAGGARADGHLAVGRRLAVRDLAHRLERRFREAVDESPIHAHVELPPVAGEILV